LKDVSIFEDWPNIDFKFMPGIETVVLQYGGSGSTVLDCWNSVAILKDLFLDGE
jgi:hypothetical protein